MASDLWTDYYRSAAVHSSTTQFPEPVRRALSERWRDLFSHLPDGAKVLDLGTGGGALLDHALKTCSPVHRLELTGVDLAEAPPASAPRSHPHGSIRYRGRIDFCNLPFEDRSYYWVTSQFALEYAPFETALSEALRVTERGVTLLVHAAEGVIVGQNVPIAGQVDWLLDELGLVKSLAAFIRDPQPERARELKRIGAAIGQACAELENPDFLKTVAGEVGRFLAHADSSSSSEGLGRLEAFEAQLRNQGQRMRELGKAGIRRESLLAVIADLEQRGFPNASLEEQRSGERDKLVAYWLTIRR